MTMRTRWRRKFISVFIFLKVPAILHGYHIQFLITGDDGRISHYQFSELLGIYIYDFYNIDNILVEVH